MKKKSGKKMVALVVLLFLTPPSINFNFYVDIANQYSTSVLLQVLNKHLL